MLLILSLPCHAQGIVVVGDSISAAPNSWANILSDEGLNVQNISMNGRQIRDFSLPRDMVADTDFGTVVYFLGINDAFVANPPVLVRRFFKSQVQYLRQRGFRVIVLIPPAVVFFEPHSTRVRSAIQRVCDKLPIECSEVTVWDPNDTVDGIHPTPALQYDIAYFVRGLLNG
jgi:hypothetical protein